MHTLLLLKLFEAILLWIAKKLSNIQRKGKDPQFQQQQNVQQNQGPLSRLHDKCGGQCWNKQKQQNMQQCLHVHLAQTTALALMSLTLTHVVSCLCQMCLGYSQHFAMFIDTLGILELPSSITLYGKPLAFPHTHQSDALLEVHDIYWAQKWAQGFENNTTSTLLPTSLGNNPLTIPSRMDLDNAVVTLTFDHPAKWSCLDKSVEKMHEPVISSTIVSCIRTRTSWDKNTDMVWLGSPSLGSESHTMGTSPSGLLDDTGRTPISLRTVLGMQTHPMSAKPLLKHS